MNLTEQQKMAVRSGEAVRARDDDLECVVVRADVYDRVRKLLYSDTDWTDDELRRAFAKSAEANGWNESRMTAYDNYDEEIRKQCR